MSRSDKIVFYSIKDDFPINFYTILVKSSTGRSTASFPESKSAISMKLRGLFTVLQWLERLWDHGHLF